MRKTKAYYKDLIYRVNGAAIEVHKELGPGLLESGLICLIWFKNRNNKQ